MKKYKYASVDNETEPDFQIVLTCTKCNETDTVIYQESYFNEIDNTNFVCRECSGYDPSDDLPGGHPAI